MKLLRAPLAALFSLFFALGAAAGVVRVPEGAGVVAPAGYAAYQAGLTALNPSVARDFLADSAAKDWLKTASPDMYASSLVRAHEIVALDELPAGHKERYLRRELIAVEALPLQQADTDLPAKHRAAYGSKADAKRVARASCAWETLSPEVRAGLMEQEVDPKGWSVSPISLRAAVIATWWQKKIFDGSKAEPGTPEYLKLMELYERKAGAYLTDQEATELDERITALTRINKRLPELRAAFAEDPAKLRELDAVVALSAEDAPKAKARLDRSFGVAPSKIPHRFVYDAHDQVQKAALAVLAKKLTAEFRRLAKGTSAEKLLEQAEGRIQIGGVPAGSDGAYQAYGDKLALPADVIDHMLVLGDRQFKDFETDSDMIQGLAVLYLPTYVHETTHRLQGRDALKRSLTAIEKGMLYGHEDEHEAYLAQELFIREFTAKRPVLAAWAKGVPRVAGIWDPVVIAKQKKRVSRLYSDVPGGHGRRAQGLLMAITESNHAVALKPRVERELARRSHAKISGETHIPVRLSDMDTPVKRAATRLLKRWRDIAGTSAAVFADKILAYLDAGDARIKALEARLRPLRAEARAARIASTSGK